MQVLGRASHVLAGRAAHSGGFDLDRGVTNSVMQYNCSYDNDGAGYLIYQYEGARPLGNNVTCHASLEN